VRDLSAFRQEAIRALNRAGEEASCAPGPEEALRVITEALFNLLGDRTAHLQPGNLKEGEQQQFACCCFIVTPDRKSNQIFAPVNFGPKQHYQKIDLGHGHPGQTVRNRKPILLANTDEHQSFVRILETFRAGSAVFAPLMWKSAAIGLLNCASQGRNTFNEADFEVNIAFSHLAAAQWIAHQGPAYLAQLAGNGR
jgi:hypothetical protein